MARFFHFPSPSFLIFWGYFVGVLVINWKFFVQLSAYVRAVTAYGAGGGGGGAAPPKKIPVKNP